MKKQNGGMKKAALLPKINVGVETGAIAGVNVG